MAMLNSFLPETVNLLTKVNISEARKCISVANTYYSEPFTN